MGFFRSDPPDESASELWNQRGTIITKETLESLPIQIHPNDKQKRVPPDGPYDMAWAGFQLLNPTSMVGTHYQRMPMNPMQHNRQNNGSTQLANPTPTFFGSGPFSSRVQLQEELDYQQNMAEARPGIIRSILNRLTGG